jgi:hypothetical protein
MEQLKGIRNKQVADSRQQLLDRDVNGGGLLTAGSGNMSFAFSSEGSAQLFARVEEPVEPVEAVEPVEPGEEAPVVEVAF